MTPRAIARRAGVTAASIYAHFADRVAILDAVIDSAVNELDEGQPHSPADDETSTTPDVYERAGSHASPALGVRE